MTQKEMAMILTAKEKVLRSIYSCTNRRQVRCAGRVIFLFEKQYCGRLGKEELKRHLQDLIDAFKLKASLYNITTYII